MLREVSHWKSGLGYVDLTEADLDIVSWIEVVNSEGALQDQAAKKRRQLLTLSSSSRDQY